MKLIFIFVVHRFLELIIDDILFLLWFSKEAREKKVF